MVWVYTFSVVFFVIAIALSYTILRGTISTQETLTEFNSQVHKLQLSITASVGSVSDYRLEYKKNNSNPRLMQLIARRANKSVEQLATLQRELKASSEDLKTNSVWPEISWIVTNEEHSLDSKLTSYLGQMRALFNQNDNNAIVSVPQIPIEAAGARYGALFLGYEKLPFN